MFVLVVTRQAATGELVRQALGAEGWWVTAVADRETAVRSASEQAPKLVVVDGQIAESAELVRDFATRQGGPGVLLLAPEGAVTEAAGEFDADEVLGPAPATEALTDAARRLLRETPPIAADGLPTPGQVLNAQDIFGDMLLEIESDSPFAEPPPPPPPVESRAGERPQPAEPPPLTDVETRPLAIPRPSVEEPMEASGQVLPEERAVAGGEPAENEALERAALAGTTADGEDGEQPGPEIEERRSGPEAISQEGANPVPMRERPAALAAPGSEVDSGRAAGAEDPEAEPDPAPPAEEVTRRPTAVSPPAAPVRPLWRRGSLPGGPLFWLGLVAGLLVFVVASLLLERLFPAAPASDPAAVTAPAVDAADLEELVERELAEREAELRESLLEEERRLQEQLEELAGDDG